MFFLCLVICMFKTGLTNILKCFFKGNVGFKGGLDSFSQNNTKTNKEHVWLWGFVC
jgi:hypothetical protein